MFIGKRLRLAIIAGVGLIGIATLAWGQGQQTLTTVLGTYLVPIQTPGAVNNAASLTTLKNFAQSAVAGQTLAPNLVHTGGVPAITNASGTDTTPVATQVYIAQIFVDANLTVTGVSVLNGSVASGNQKVGLADSTGAIIATSASTAEAGTTAYQRIPFTAPVTLNSPGTYYVLQFIDNATARFRTHVFGDFRTAIQTGQVYATGFTTITPPTTFTTAQGPIASLY